MSTACLKCVSIPQKKVALNSVHWWTEFKTGEATQSGLRNLRCACTAVQFAACTFAACTNTARQRETACGRKAARVQLVRWRACVKFLTEPQGCGDGEPQRTAHLRLGSVPERHAASSAVGGRFSNAATDLSTSLLMPSMRRPKLNSPASFKNFHSGRK